MKILFALLLVAANPSPSEGVRPILDRVFPGTVRIDTLSLEKSVMVISSADSVTGYALIDNAKGKDQLITYLVAVGTDLRVRAVEILAYREAYGGEIRNKSWRDQFNGKGPGEELRPGKEIRTITGATISSRSVTAGVKNALALFHHERDRLPKGRWH